MHTFITVIAILMLADACFTLLNLSKVKSIFNEIFPKLDVKKLAAVEGAVGLVIIIIKVGTGTIA